MRPGEGLSRLLCSRWCQRSCAESPHADACSRIGFFDLEMMAQVHEAPPRAGLSRTTGEVTGPWRSEPGPSREGPSRKMVGVVTRPCQCW
ncbi:unnamed protein product [Gadus morhua 'NCC']